MSGHDLSVAALQAHTIAEARAHELAQQQRSPANESAMDQHRQVLDPESRQKIGSPDYNSGRRDDFNSG